MDPLEALAHLLDKSKDELDKSNIPLVGFVAVHPDILADVMRKLKEIIPSGTSLDLGCGNGGWVLMAAAAGYKSYGIEINPLLIDICKKNYQEAIRHGIIKKDAVCVFEQADMIPSKYHNEYELFQGHHAEAKASAPKITANQSKLPVTIKNADIIYCWAWPTQSRFLFNVINKEAKADAIFVLPSYKRYLGGEHMNASMSEKNELMLQELAIINDVFIGKRLNIQ
jgi:SAM-dependent methyltransferase